ncbi:transcriptional regulator ATRX isoform X2 [Nematostella vectensis]|uniref:transcriptional regulator ATRX isoform X2 n=1 Tax=Nematostella vectensis TaxID=45351 RepID=UPI002076DF7E|nr:transcriptional regulator ATRX isoform X2 [Nematostella vectensis]
MSEPVPGKPKGKKLDSIISKLRLKPAEACDSEEESGPVQSKGGLEEVIDSGGEALDSGEELNIRRRSKRKSGKTVHYQRLVINDDDDDDDDGVEAHALDDLPPPELPLEDAGSIEDTNITAEEVPPYDNIADLLSDGPRLVEEEETVVLIVPPESIKVQAAAVEGDELRDLSEIEEEHEEHKPKKEKRDKKKKDKKKKKEYSEEQVEGAASAAESNEEGEKEKEKKKSKKKKKVADSDVSMDEDGLPKRVTCTACGRHINPSHGKILRHPTLNVLVCKKCNQYYNSGPFTRDEYGIEEQCRWCGDGGALICCDKCEKAFCQPCIKRNCGKAYLKEVMNAPDDYHWNCFSCKLNNPLPAVAQLQKRCNYVMDILDSLRSRKAPFKSKIGQPNVISGPTPLERRSQLNTLSGTLGIKVEGWLSSPEKSPTKKEFSKVVEPPPLLFDDSEAGPSNAKQDEKGKEKKADKRSDEPQDKEDKTTGNEKERPGRMIVRLDEVSCKTKKQKEQDTNGKSSDEDGEGIDEPNLLERISEMSRTEEGKLSERTENEGKISEGEEKNEGAGSSTIKTSRMLRSKSKVISEITKEAGSDSGSSSSRKETRRSKKKNNESRSSDTKEVSRHGKTDKKNNDKKDDESSRKDKVQEEDDDVDDDQPNEMVKQESGLDSKDESEEVEERRTTRSGKTNRSGKDSQSKLTTQSSAKENTEEVSKSSKKQEVIILDDDYSSSEEPVTKRKTRSERKRNELVKKEVLSGNDSESSLEKQNKKGTQKGKKGKQAKTSPESDSSESSDDENRISTLKVRFGFAKGARSSRSKHSNSDSTSKNRKKPVKMEKVSENDESDSDLVSKKQSGKYLSKNKKTTPLNTKYDSKSESGDSDFVSKKQSKKNATSKNNNKTPVKPEGSSGSEESDSNSKTKPSNKKSSVKKNKKMEQSESEESSDSGPKRRKGNSQKRMVNQKSTRKRPRPASSDSSSAESPEQSSEESSESSEEESARKQRLRRRQRLEDSDDSDGEDTKTKKSKIQKQKKTPKRRRTRANKGKSSSEEPSESESEESSDDSEVKKRPKRNAKRNQKKGKMAKGKRKRVKEMSESEDENEEEPDTPSKSKGRRKIRKLLTDEKLGEETKKARRLEEERRQRLLERTQNLSEDMPNMDWKVDSLVLESDPETKEPIVEVNKHIVKYLKPHQCKGVQFMYDCLVESVKAYKKGEPGSGCILAHCMGLGKTLQVVTLVHTLFNNKELEFTTALVVAPLNTLLNWQVEFEKWLSVDDRMEVYVLQEVGHNSWRRADMLTQWQRYGGIMIMGYDMYRNLSLCNNVRSKKVKKIFKETLVDPGPDIVICDEGHILKNDASAISRALNAIKTRRRVVLTGTPLQNNLIEYHCMVSFVKPSLLGTRKEFMNTFGNPIQNGQCADSTPSDFRIMKQRCHVLFKMLEGCVQRRDYSVLTPFLPAKHEYVIKVRLSEAQRKLYEHYLKTFVFPEGDVTKRGVGLFSDYQALMRIWTHPWCLKLEAIRRSMRMTYDDSDDSLDGFVVHTDEESESTAESESEEDTDANKGRGKSRRKEIDTSSEEEQSDEDESSSGDEVIPEKRASGTARKTRNSLQTTRSSKPSKVEIDGEDVVEVDAKPGPSGVELNGDPALGNTRSGQNFKDDEVEAETEWYDEFLTQEAEYNVELSGKLVLLLEILADAEAVEEKVLVFSQSLVSLDLIERALGGGEVGGDRENWCKGCDYFRMDGSTSVQLRQRWADIFNDPDNKTARLFLISTKAGGLGINLVAANRVIVFDASWNPSHDVQSIFRVYRFGQTKAVYVYRFLSQGTMEERVYDRQVAKLSISERVVDKHQIERHFTAADLAELYKFDPDVLDETKNKEDIPSLPLPKDAILADLINRMHPQWIVKYHEHDSLLRNIEEEELTEEEMKIAWKAYQDEKEAANNPAYARQLEYERYQEQQRLYQQQAQQIAQQQPGSSRQVPLDPVVLQQIQRIQQQQADRQRRFQEEMQRISQERQRFLQQQSSLQDQQFSWQQQQLRQLEQQMPRGPADAARTEQMRRQILDRMGTHVPVHAPPQVATGAASQHPMVRFISQQQAQNLVGTGTPGTRLIGVNAPTPQANGPSLHSIGSQGRSIIPQTNGMRPVSRP